VKADKQRLRQVFLNLLSNAIRFTGAGGISLQVKTIAGNKDSFGIESLENILDKVLEIRIADSGIGLD